MSEDTSRKRDRNTTLTPEDQSAFSSGMEFLSKTLKAVFILLAGAIIIMLAWFLTCGGSFIVDSTSESVIVLKFGKFEGEYKEGWHWFLPYPINKIVRIPTKKVTIVTKTFLPSNEERLRDPNAKTPMGSSGGESLAPGVDGYALLSDNAILHSEWALTFRIAAPEQFYKNYMCRPAENFDTVSGDTAKFGSTNMEHVDVDSVSDILRPLLDAAVIEAGTVLTIDTTYYNTDLYRQTVEDILRKKIHALEIGIDMENLSLSICAPPLKTRQAFQDYQLAKTTAEREVESARTYEVEQKNLAFAESEQIRSRGEQDKIRLTKTAEADAKSFTKFYNELQSGKSANEQAATITKFYMDALSSAVTPVKEKYIVSTDADSKSEVRLHLNPEPKKDVSILDQAESDTEKK